MLYFKIIKLKEYVNDTYSFQLFITFTSFFIEYVYFIFFIIVMLGAPETRGRNLSLSQAFKFVMWTSTLCGRMLTMIKCCNSIAQKIKKTGSVINSILSKPVDPQTKNEVHFFYLFQTSNL